MSKKSLLERIKAFLKLDDAGKIESFLKRQIKLQEREIEAIKQNKTAEEFEYNRNKLAIQEKLQDASEAFEESFLAVNLDRIKTNQDQDAFAIDYWDNIKSRENTIENLKKELNSLEEKYQDSIKELDSQIEKYEKRISYLS